MLLRGVFQSALDSGPGSDTMSVPTTIPTTLTGGTGDDKLTGGNGGDTLLGGDGDDVLLGSGGADTLDGGLDDDSMTGSAGPDVHVGGGGIDTASYAGRGAGVSADIDGVADDGSSADGAAGARDNVATDVEKLIGTDGPDTLIGSAGANTLDGGAGNDALLGSGGDDTLIGGLDDDTLTGSSGADVHIGSGGSDTASYAGRGAGVIVDLDSAADDGSSADGPAGARDTVGIDVENLLGTDGPDTLTGSTGHNRLTGGLGADRLRGRNGNDNLVAKDGVVDTEISCDGGSTPGLADVASVDAADPAATGCETVTT